MTVSAVDWATEKLQIILNENHFTSKKCIENDLILGIQSNIKPYILSLLFNFFL